MTSPTPPAPSATQPQVRCGADDRRLIELEERRRTLAFGRVHVHVSLVAAVTPVDRVMSGVHEAPLVEERRGHGLAVDGDGALTERSALRLDP